MSNRILVLKKIRRYRRIINILLKYGLEIVIDRTNIYKFPFRKKKKIEYSFPVRIRKILEELGPTFIKLGQILSTRPDLIPMDYIKELEKLQDEAIPEKFEIIEEVIKRELGKEIKDIFEDFQKEPIASASLSCVYKAKYKGKDVAVKIQRPNVKEQIITDIQILYDIANLIEKFIKESEIYQPVKIVSEFEKNIKKELNFLIEKKNIEIIKEKMKNDENVFIPSVYKELCTEKILVTEYIEGVKINRVEEWSKYISKEEVLKKGTEIILKQIFEIGLFHGDPHPGNIFIKNNGKIALIDFGIVGRLDEERKYYVINLTSSIIKGKVDGVISILKSMGSLEGKIEIHELRDEIEEMIEVYKDIPIKDIKISELLGICFDIMRRYKIKIPVSFTLMAKSIITLEGICHFIDPEFKIINAIEPFYFELIEKKVKFSYFIKEIKNTIDKFQYGFKEIPETIESLLDTIREFKKRNYKNEEFSKNLSLVIKKTGIKISFSLFISSLLISWVFLYISEFFILSNIIISIVIVLIFIFFLNLRKD